MPTTANYLIESECDVRSPRFRMHDLDWLLRGERAFFRSVRRILSSLAVVRHHRIVGAIVARVVFVSTGLPIHCRISSRSAPRSA